MLGELSADLDRAEADEAVVVILTGARATFSAGFDLRTAAEGWPDDARRRRRLAERMLSFPRPVVVACTGNAIAMGAFLLLSADHRIGAAGDVKIGLNEVAIGLTLPVVRDRDRQAPALRARTTTAAPSPARCWARTRRTAGFLDTLVAPEELHGARAPRPRLGGRQPAAHAATKLRIRERGARRRARRHRPHRAGDRGRLVSGPMLIEGARPRASRRRRSTTCSAPGWRTHPTRSAIVSAEERMTWRRARRASRRPRRRLPRARPGSPATGSPR